MLKQIKQLINAISSPRYYLELANYSKKKLFILSLIPILLLSLINFLDFKPQLDGIFNQITLVQDNIPEFSYENQKLTLDSKEKALYYTSDDIQVVIDPSVESNPIFNTIPISKEQYQLIDENKLINLYLFQDQAFIYYVNQAYEINQPNLTIINRQNLINQMQTIVQNKDLSYIILFMITFLASSLIYWIMISLSAILCGIMNRYLSNQLKFKQRLRILIPISVIPFVFVALISMIMNELFLPVLMIIFYCVYTYYLAFKHQTIIVQQLNATIEKHQVNITVTAENIQEIQDKQLQRIQRLQKLKLEFLQKYQESKTKKDKNLSHELNKLQTEIISLELTIQSIQIEIDKYLANHDQQ